jgi:acyl-CoA synthetase (AMP-forming)/AMP-acid ligase II
MSWIDVPRTRLEVHYGNRVTRCFAERPKSVNQILRESVAKYGRHEALVDGERRFDYRDLDRLVSSVAAGLAARGVAKGDRVALLLSNSAEFVFAFFATLRLGAIAVPVNVREQEPGLRFTLNNCTAKIVIHDADVAERLPPSESIQSVTHRFSVGEDTPVGSQDFSVLSSSVSALDIPAEEDEDATVVILYTSGTTGKPKGAELTNTSMVISAMHFESCWKLTSEDRAIMATPATHVTGLVAIMLSMVRTGGATIILRTFQAEEFIKLAAAEHMTYALMVPAMYHLCLLRTNFADHDLSSWRIGGYGGSPMPAATIEALSKLLPNLSTCNCYGATETTSPSTMMPLHDGVDHVHTVGKPAPCADIRIMDEDGREVPVGTSGEIWISGGQIVTGYWNNPEATREAFVSGYWLSGDVGAMTASGYVQIFDRKKDMINRGGYKIYSAEVESVLAHHPDVAESAVVAYPDPVLGERVRAFIFTEDDTLTGEDIAAHCGEWLSDYKVPDIVTFIDQPLPRNASGKILKRALNSTYPK